LDACFLDEKGERKAAVMGCYGIGVNRILAASIEEHHDEKGILWPLAIAPFDVEIITVNEAIVETQVAARKIESDLEALGLDVLYDNREERAGVKFNDADLIGIPVQVTVGERGLKEGQVELKLRRTGEVQKVALDDITKQVQILLAGLTK
ncbi:MAG: proline--tRNA ligase, partial [Candidatus Omnitrophica bacterium]|nr:proline--tRNA ligase [Candidatus Omnitrophota bacterium]